MLDQTDYTPPSTDWQQRLSRGDIVRFRFPVKEPCTSGERPKLRPCLVLEIVDFGGTRFITLAYGTSADTKANRGQEVLVTKPASMQAAGLEKPTRFVCARRCHISHDHPGFEVAADIGTPVIGHLDEVLTERMNAVRARLQAEADIAAEAREARRRERETWRREAREFQQRNRAFRGETTHGNTGVQQ
jgi:hypothetical protein